MKLYPSRHFETAWPCYAMQVEWLTPTDDIPDGVCVVPDANDWKACRDMDDGVVPAHIGDWIVRGRKDGRELVRVVSDKYFRANWMAGPDA